MRTDWGFVHQDARDGLRMGVSAGANVGERMMAVGERLLVPYGISDSAVGFATCPISDLLALMT